MYAPALTAFPSTSMQVDVFSQPGAMCIPLAKRGTRAVSEADVEVGSDLIWLGAAAPVVVSIECVQEDWFHYRQMMT